MEHDLTLDKSRKTFNEIKVNTMQDLQRVFFQLLSKHNFKISQSYLDSRILSHPEYPSLLCLTDILSDLNIEHTVVKIEKELITQISGTFLVHLDTTEGAFHLVEDGRQFKDESPALYKAWRGVILGIEKNESWKHPDNDKYILKDKKHTQLRSLSIVTLLSFALISIYTQSEWLVAPFLLISFVGILLSWALVCKELGFNNNLADQLCDSSSNCDKKSEIRLLRYFGEINISDLSIIWFVWSFSTVMISLLLYSS